MKKTLFVTLEFPPNIGGVATYYYNLLRNSDKNLYVLTLPIKNSLTSVYKDNAPPDIVIREEFLFHTKFLWPKWILLLIKMWKYSRKYSIELICVGQILPVGICAYFIFKVLKIPYAVFVHGMDITVPSGRKKYFIKKILSQAKLVIANSNYTKKLICLYNKKITSVQVIYPGIDMAPSANESLIEQ